MALSPQQDERILTVGELTRAIKETLNTTFPAIWVKGELSGLKRPDSGHLYFNLKEGTQAVIACAMWRASAARLAFDPRDGAYTSISPNASTSEPSRGSNVSRPALPRHMAHAITASVPSLRLK